MTDSLAVGLVINARDMTSATLRAIGGAFDRLRAQGDRLRAGLAEIGAGLRSLAMQGAGMGVTLGLMANQASNYEQALAGVRAVMIGTAEEDLVALDAEIQRLGATTSKSASEAAEGAELLARAGFSAQENIRALGGVLALAEAEAVDMRIATDVTANTLRTFALDASEAGRVADVLAMTSARTNTNVIQLGEAMTYAAPTAVQLGQSVEDTAFALGLLANTGLQGSVGGTALKNMLLQLASASDETRAQFDALGIVFEDANGDMIPMSQIIENIATALPQLGGNAQQASWLVDTLGLRGMAAGANLASAFTQMSDMVEGPGGEMITRFEALRNEILNADGAARMMADERLNTLRGQFVLLNSAMEGASIAVFTRGLDDGAGFVGRLAEGIGRLTEGVRNAEAILAGEYNPTLTDANHLGEDATNTWLQIGVGVNNAFDMIGRGIAKIREAGSSILDYFGPEAGEQIGRYGTIAALAITALAVAAGAVFLFVGPLVSGLASIASGLVTVAAALPLTPILLFLAYVQATRAEGESFGQRFMAIFGRVRDFVLEFAEGFMLVYHSHIQPALHGFVRSAVGLWEAISPIFVAIQNAFGGTGESGSTLGAIFGFVVTGIVGALGMLIEVVTAVTEVIVGTFIVPVIEHVGEAMDAFMGLLNGVEDFPSAFGRIFRASAQLFIDVFLAPVKAGILFLLEGLNAVGAISDERLAAMQAGMNFSLPEPAAAQQERREAHEANVAANDAARQQRDAIAAGNQSPEVTIMPPETRVEGCIDNRINLDSREITAASSHRQFELAQRGGASLNPWQRGAVIGGGAVAMP